MGPKSAAYGPLLFVNSDQSDGGTVTDRRKVYQHVQLRYAKWKRVETSRKARASVKSSNERHGSGSSDLITQSSYSTSDDSSVFSATSNAVARQPQNARESSLGKVYLPDPMTILREGNSDPFDVFAVHVGPKINALMEYSRDYFLPGIQRDINNPGSKLVRPAWAQCVSFLHDEGLAYSHFARISALIASDPKQSDVTRDFRTLALIFKSKSIAVLRRRLEEIPGDSRTYNQILLLMNAETFDRNLDAASSHAAVLVNLLQSGTIKGDLAFVFKAVYYDAQRAAMSLTRPLFDAYNWVPEQIMPISDVLAQRPPGATQPDTLTFNLDICLDSNPALRSTLIVFKQLCMGLVLIAKKQSVANEQFLFHGRFHMTLMMTRLINHYLDAVESLTARTSYWNTGGDSVSHACLARFSASTSLASILMHRCFTRIDKVKINGDIALFDANTLIMKRLKEILMTNDRRSFTETQGKFANAKLYALFVGAWVEQTQAVRQKYVDKSSPDSNVGSLGSEVESDWFSYELSRQARAMNLYEWTEVKKVLQGFVYAEVLELQGAHWFSQIVQMM